MNATTAFRANATALITGAATGIGRSFANFCASRCMNLILVDRDEPALHGAKETLGSLTPGIVHTRAIDVANYSEWADLRASFKHINIDVLHLNAGVGGEARWKNRDAFERIFRVNISGVTNGIHAFIEDFDLNHSHRKAIVISGSKQGITNPPGNPAYNASKSAVNSIAEHLHYDLSMTSPNTSVHLFVPGWTWTPMNGSTRIAIKPEGAWTPKQTVSYLVSKMEDGDFYVICPGNEVDLATDRKRILWTAGDMIYGRKPLSRWREEYSEEAERTMSTMTFDVHQAR